MSLSCSCSDDCDWYYTPADDYQILDTKRSRKCASCHQRIPVGSIVLRLDRFYFAQYPSIKEKIYGEGNEVYMSPWWYCERCADLFLSLSELGFCTMADDNMLSLVKEYAEVYGKH